MTVVLLANVGNSDLVVDKNALPEREAKHPFDEKWPMRALGEEVQANYDRYRASIQLPLIGKALDAVREYGDPDIHVVLFASNQDQNLVDHREYLKDTTPAAEVIRRFLNEGKNPPKSVRIKKIAGNPADYANALDFLKGNLQDIAKKTPPDAHIFAEVSGGTPAMTAMLIVQSVEVFGQDVTILYVDRGSASAREVDVARSLFARKTRDTLRAQLRVHAYSAAQQTVADSGGLLIGDNDRRELIGRLVAYADRRLAFDFKRARQELQRCRAVGELQARITHWQRELIEGNREKNLEELIHSTSIKLRQGEYADLTQRLFRFQEECLREIAERLGRIEYGKDDRCLSSSWLDTQPDLRGYAANYKRDTKGVLRDKPQSKDGVDLSRTLNRYNLGTLVDYYVDRAGSTSLREAAEQIFRLSQVADLRNRGIAGHGFEGIGQEDLETAYGAGEEVLMDSLRKVYELLYGAAPANDPYASINELILSLIEDAP